MWRLVIKGMVFIVPVTVTFLDKVATVSKVTGKSMQPCFNPADKRSSDVVVLNRWKASDYKFSRGEIVTFIAPFDHTQTMIKRIIALEGDIVRPFKGQKKELEVVVPQGHCWVEGDNCSVSVDSNLFGPVSISLITAKATHIIWPPSRWQKLNTSELDCDRVRKGPPLSEIEELVAV